MIEDNVSLLESVIEFCQFTRNSGWINGIDETLLSLEAVCLGGIYHEDTVRNMLRAILSTSKEEYLQFDQVFDSYSDSLHL